MRRGQHHTPEARAKIAAGMKGKRNFAGKTMSPEAKAAIAKSLRRYHALRRAGLWE